MIFSGIEKLKNPGALIDSHCHLNEKAFDADRSDVVARAVEAGIGVIVDMAIDLESSHRTLENAAKFDAVVAAVGIDPQIAIPGGDYFDERFLERNFREAQVEKLEELVSKNRELIAMLGETGIDDYWLQRMEMDKQVTTVQRTQSLEIQEELFRAHLALSEKYNLPLSVHSRAAEQRCLQIVREFPAARGIFHSFTGSSQTAKEILASGWGIGVNAIITYKSASELKEMYAGFLSDIKDELTPERLYNKGIYLETDAPYLVPSTASFAAGRNEPMSVKNVFAALQKLVKLM